MMCYFGLQLNDKKTGLYVTVWSHNFVQAKLDVK